MSSAEFAAVGTEEGEEEVERAFKTLPHFDIALLRLRLRLRLPSPPHLLEEDLRAGWAARESSSHNQRRSGAASILAAATTRLHAAALAALA